MSIFSHVKRIAAISVIVFSLLMGLGIVFSKVDAPKGDGSAAFTEVVTSFISHSSAESFSGRSSLLAGGICNALSSNNGSEDSPTRLTRSPRNTRTSGRYSSVSISPIGLSGGYCIFCGHVRPVPVEVVLSLRNQPSLGVFRL